MTEKDMTEKEIRAAVEHGEITDDMDTSSVLEGAEPWEPIETKLVLYSFLVAAIALIIGLIVVPTSILH